MGEKDSGASDPLLVPVLVSSDPNVADQPIIGYNVIEEVTGDGWAWVQSQLPYV